MALGTGAAWLLGALGFGLAMSDDKKKAAPSPNAPGVPSVPGIPEVLPPGGVTDKPITPGALDLLTEARKLPDGTIVRYFSAQARSVLLQGLAARSLKPVPSSHPTVGIFQTIDGQPVVVGPPGTPPTPAVNARLGVEQAAAGGVSVIATLGLGVPQNPGGFVGFTTAAGRSFAHLTSGWAVLFDGAGVAPGVPVQLQGPQPAVPPLPQSPNAPPPPITPPGPQPPAQPAPGPQPAPGVPQLDPNMSPEVRAEVERMLTDPDADPFALEEAAAALGPRFPLAAAALRARAAELKDRERLKAIQRGGSEFTVRFGDLPSRMAQYYTGDAARFKEIPPLNPGMRIETKPSPVTGAPTTFLIPFNPGQKVLLPTSWKIWEKPLPPVATGVPKTIAPPPKPQPAPPPAQTALERNEAQKQALLDISRKGGQLTPAQLAELSNLNKATERLSQLAAAEELKKRAERELGGGRGTTPAERLAAQAAAEAAKRGLSVPTLPSLPAGFRPPNIV